MAEAFDAVGRDLVQDGINLLLDELLFRQRWHFQFGFLVLHGALPLSDPRVRPLFFAALTFFPYVLVGHWRTSVAQQSHEPPTRKRAAEMVEIRNAQVPETRSLQHGTDRG